MSNVSTNKVGYHSAFAFAVLGLIWGSNFIYMKMAAELISSSQVVFYRVLFGFIPVFIYALYRRDLRLNHLRHSIHFIVMSLLATTVYYYMFVKGTELLLSGVAGALSGSIPLFSFILAVIFIPEERATVMKSLGVLIGFSGVVLVGYQPEMSVLNSDIAGVAYMSCGALCVGASFVYARRFITPLGLPSAALTTYQLGYGLIMLSLFTDFNGITAVFSDVHTSVGLILGLGLLGTGLAYIIYYYIVKTLGAVTASSATYIPPVVALFIGAIIVGEDIVLTDYMATLMIFIGVILLKKR